MKKTITELPQMFDETEVARVLAVSVAALRRWRREGCGPQFTRLERCVRYDMRAVERFLAKNCSNEQPDSQPPLAVDPPTEMKRASELGAAICESQS